MTKDEVLATLLRNNGFVSGESMSSVLGISRAAVNGAIKQLRLDGCIIESVTNKGYRIEYCPDRLYAGDVYSYLDTERCKSVICISSVDSTNNMLKEMAQKGTVTEGTCIIANEQTGGRGRLGRSFISPANTGLYMSILIRPKGAVADISEITAWTAVAVHNAIKIAYGVDTGIKWVNDLYINERKMTGILTEMTFEGEVGIISNVIIGIGINVSQKESDFPEELSDIATSIAQACGLTGLSRAKLAGEVIKEVDKLSASWPSGKDSYLETYRNSCITLGRNVVVSNYATGETRNAFAVDINEDFSLKVRYEDGSIGNIISGEVSVKPSF